MYRKQIRRVLEGCFPEPNIVLGEGNRVGLLNRRMKDDEYALATRLNVLANPSASPWTFLVMPS